MDFTKFVTLLSDSALFFSRADKRGDRFEGSYPRRNLVNRYDENNLEVAGDEAIDLIASDAAEGLSP